MTTHQEPRPKRNAPDDGPCADCKRSLSDTMFDDSTIVHVIEFNDSGNCQRYHMGCADINGEPLRDFGWANSWDQQTRKEIAERERRCSVLNHHKQDVDIGPPYRGLEHVVTCRICGFRYRYDSSD